MKPKFLVNVISGLIAILLLMLGPKAHSAAALSLDAIKNKYRGVSEFEATIEQTKESPLLLRPLKSRVKIEFIKDLLKWQPENQKAWIAQFLEDGSVHFIDQDPALDQMPADTKKKLDKTLVLVRNLMTMNPHLEEEFELQVEGNFLKIIPKARHDEILFQNIRIEFKSNLEIAKILLVTRDDSTTLEFKSMSVSRK